MKAWGFFRSTGHVPTDAELARVRAETGWKRVVLNGGHAHGAVHCARRGTRSGRHRQGLCGGCGDRRICARMVCTRRCFPPGRARSMRWARRRVQQAGRCGCLIRSMKHQATFDGRAARHVAIHRELFGEALCCGWSSVLPHHGSANAAAGGRTAAGDGDCAFGDGQRCVVECDVRAGWRRTQASDGLRCHGRTRRWWCWRVGVKRDIGGRAVSARVAATLAWQLASPGWRHRAVRHAACSDARAIDEVIVEE